jgi:hypothetical protein
MMLPKQSILFKTLFSVPNSTLEKFPMKSDFKKANV